MRLWFLEVVLWNDNANCIIVDAIGIIFLLLKPLREFHQENVLLFCVDSHLFIIIALSLNAGERRGRIFYFSIIDILYESLFCSIARIVF